METDTLLIGNVAGPDSRYHAISRNGHNRRRIVRDKESSSDDELLDLTMDEEFIRSGHSNQHEGCLSISFAIVFALFSYADFM